MGYHTPVCLESTAQVRGQARQSLLVALPKTNCGAYQHLETNSNRICRIIARWTSRLQRKMKLIR
jgi:hypothetical protein